jgi:hypothetical protein
VRWWSTRQGISQSLTCYVQRAINHLFPIICLFSLPIASPDIADRPRCHQRIETDIEAKLLERLSRDLTDGFGSQPDLTPLECKLEHPPTRGDGSCPPHIPLSFSPQMAGWSLLSSSIRPLVFFGVEERILQPASSQSRCGDGDIPAKFRLATRQWASITGSKMLYT